MLGKVLKIEEGAFGGDILTISYEGATIESRRFINGQTIPKVLIEGDVVEYETYFNEIANKHFAKVLGLLEKL